MANHYSDQYYQPAPGTGSGGDVKALVGEITFATAPSSSDVIYMFKAPAGFTPLYGWLMGDDIDTGTEALELDVGITGDAQKYLNSGVISGDTIANEKSTIISGL